VCGVPARSVACSASSGFGAGRAGAIMNFDNLGDKGVITHALGNHNIMQRSQSSPRESGGFAEHKVKSWPQFFEAIVSGKKKHELRRADDRDFQVGDTLRLQEFNPDTQRYSGREFLVRITFITSADRPCALSESALNSDYCILSIEAMEDSPLK